MIDPALLSARINRDIPEYLSSYLVSSSRNGLTIIFALTGRCEIMEVDLHCNDCTEITQFHQKFKDAVAKLIGAEIAHSGCDGVVPAAVSQMPNAVSRALCMITKARNDTPFQTVHAQILCITPSSLENAQQQMMMNAAFTARDAHVVINSFALSEESSLLSQISSITNGTYICLRETSEPKECSSSSSSVSYLLTFFLSIYLLFCFSFILFHFHFISFLFLSFLFNASFPSVHPIPASPSSSAHTVWAGGHGGIWY